MTVSTNTMKWAARNCQLLAGLGLFFWTTNESMQAQESSGAAWRSVLEPETKEPGLRVLPPTVPASPWGQDGYRPAALGQQGRFTPTALPVLPNSPNKISRTAEQSPISGAAFYQQESPQNAPTESTDSERRFGSGWRLKSVGELELMVVDDRRQPDNTADTLLQSSPQGDQHQMVDVGGLATWIAPNLSYQPLLFEDARLERSGYASPYFAIQPIRSGLHFTHSSLLLPVRAWFHRNEMESPLAFERPGSYAAPSEEIFLPAFGHR